MTPQFKERRTRNTGMLEYRNSVRKEAFLLPHSGIRAFGNSSFPLNCGACPTRFAGPSSGPQAPHRRAGSGKSNPTQRRRDAEVKPGIGRARSGETSGTHRRLHGSRSNRGMLEYRNSSEGTSLSPIPAFTHSGILLSFEPWGVSYALRRVLKSNSTQRRRGEAMDWHCLIC